jgi:hypothetical protein
VRSERRGRVQTKKRGGRESEKAVAQCKCNKRHPRWMLLHHGAIQHAQPNPSSSETKAPQKISKFGRRRGRRGKR